MASNVYECLFILDPNRYARDPQGVAASIPEMVEKFSGEILANRLWNEQKLAYPINGHRKGTYWLTYFRMESSELVGFNRACQLNDFVMRHMATKVDPRLVEILVAHARGEKTADELAEEAQAEAQAAAQAEAKQPAEATTEVAAATDE